MTIKEKMKAFGCGVVALLGSAGAVNFGVQALNTQHPLFFVGAVLCTGAALEAFYLLCDKIHSHCKEI